LSSNSTGKYLDIKVSLV